MGLKREKDFVSLLSHELRGHIQSILGYAELLELNPINSKDYINKIKENSERLNLLVLDILDVTRIENSLFKFKSVPINLNDILLSVIEDINQKIKDNMKKIDIIFPCNGKYTTKTKESDVTNSKKYDYHNNEYTNIIVLGDKQRLYQVIFNLLDNTIKFINKEGIIHVLLEKRYFDNTSVNGTTTTNTNNFIIENNDNKSPKENGDRQTKFEIVVVTIKDNGGGINSKVL
jgi:signal transduction histidine kinase